MKTQWRTYFLFCAYYNFNPVPCELDVLCLYAQFLSRSFKSVDSIKNYIYGVKTLHLFLDLPFTHLDSFYFKLFVKGLKRSNPHTVKAALPITPEILFKIREIINFENDNHVTYWCLFLFAFYLMCRKSNLVGTVENADKCLKRGDISVHKRFLQVKFHWSKTIQYGERCLEIPILAKSESPLCAVSAYTEMCSRFPAPTTSPAFVISVNNKIKQVSYNMLQTFLKGLIASIGLNPSDYSSHSFRRGGATWAFKCGVPSELIQLQGDWKSDAYKLYLKYGFSEKLMISKNMISNL